MKSCCAIFVALFSATPLWAFDLHAVEYSIRGPKDPVVRGRMTVDGYDWATVRRFIAEDCAGATGEIVRVGKPRRAKAAVNLQLGKVVYIQRFRTSCEGGANPALGFGDSLTVNVHRELNGQNVGKYTYCNKRCEKARRIRR